MAWAKRRGAALRRDLGACQYCLAEATTVDHVVPRSRGGGSDLSNLLAACEPCNTVKDAMTLAEWVASGKAPVLAGLTLRYWETPLEVGPMDRSTRCAALRRNRSRCPNQTKPEADMCGLHLRLRCPQRDAGRATVPTKETSPWKR